MVMKHLFHVLKMGSLSKTIVSETLSKSLSKTTVSILTMAALFSGLSSCRIQNKQTVTLKGYDTISGYYSTQLQQIEAVVKVRGETEPRRRNLTVAFAIPKFLDTVTDPVLLFFDSPLKGNGTLRHNMANDQGFPVNVNMDDRSLSYSQSANSKVEKCMLLGDELDTGSYTEALGDQNGFSVKGTIRITFSLGYRFVGDAEGDCIGPMANFFEACYLDASKCNQSDGNLIHSIFDRYVNSGVLNSNEIRNVESVRLFMRYE